MQGIGMTGNELDTLALGSPALHPLDPLTGAPNPIMHNMLSSGSVSSSPNLYGGAGPLSAAAQHQLHSIRQKARQLSCAHLDGLSKGQTQICELNKDHIYFIGRAARMGIGECQFQFQKSRWNCSTFNDSSVFGPILNTGKNQ